MSMIKSVLSILKQIIYLVLFLYKKKIFANRSRRFEMSKAFMHDKYLIKVGTVYVTHLLQTLLVLCMSLFVDVVFCFCLLAR